jgi:hypothetical protein
MESTVQESCMPTDHRIIIAQRGNFVVRPGRLNVRRGDTVTWITIGTAARIFFPDKRLFGPDRRVLDVCREDESAREATPDDPPVVSQSLKVLDDAPFKVYSYSIFCDTSNTFAQGGSDPELIVGF